jgi:uncharacterized protein (DUF1810 family)
MAKSNEADAASDAYDLSRFVKAQEGVYEGALAELRSGQKRSHWMWFVFPQRDGLGSSATSKRYAIKSLAEAEAYLRHPLLGPRLLECFEAVLAVAGRSAREIMGSPDDLKLKSCATLFERADCAQPAFGRALDKYFEGQRDAATLRLLGAADG